MDGGRGAAARDLGHPAHVLPNLHTKPVDGRGLVLLSLLVICICLSCDKQPAHTEVLETQVKLRSPAAVRVSSRLCIRNAKAAAAAEIGRQKLGEVLLYTTLAGVRVPC